ncbi:MAG: hypothetical protein M3495_11930 [Pseudomonadota bacterium]|nr:hypothetical protein [Pseudomonadota bacterium]
MSMRFALCQALPAIATRSVFAVSPDRARPLASLSCSMAWWSVGRVGLVLKWARVVPGGRCQELIEASFSRGAITSRWGSGAPPVLIALVDAVDVQVARAAVRAGLGAPRSMPVGRVLAHCGGALGSRRRRAAPAPCPPA